MKLTFHSIPGSTKTEELGISELCSGNVEFLSMVTVCNVFDDFSFDGRLKWKLDEKVRVSESPFEETDAVQIHKRHCSLSNSKSALPCVCLYHIVHFLYKALEG